MANRSHITRRGALSTLAMAPVAAAVPAAAASEHPWDKANRLAEELAAALMEGDDDNGGPAGRWYAEVHPETSRWPMRFGSLADLNRVKSPEERVNAASAELASAMAALHGGEWRTIIEHGVGHAFVFVAPRSSGKSVFESA